MSRIEIEKENGGMYNTRNICRNQSERE
jgi:hypothetical protein